MWINLSGSETGNTIAPDTSPSLSSTKVSLEIFFESDKSDVRLSIAFSRVLARILAGTPAPFNVVEGNLSEAENTIAPDTIASASSFWKVLRLFWDPDFVHYILGAICCCYLSRHWEDTMWLGGGSAEETKGFVSEH